MIGVYDELMDGIPVLMVVDQAKTDEALPVVTYFHGFTSAKEHNLPFAYLMAHEGYLVVMPDSLYHGDREVNISQEELQLSFWDIVMKNVDELPLLYRGLEAKGLLLDKRFGVAGTSMGGITTAASLARHPWVRAAAILMGSPKLKAYANDLIKAVTSSKNIAIPAEEIERVDDELGTYDLAENMEALHDRPISFWHGEEDDVVPIRHARSFYEEAQGLYEDKTRIQFLSEPGTRHKVSRFAIRKTKDWFMKFL